MSLRKDQDIVLGIIILLFSLLCWSQAGKLSGPPVAMPRIFLVMMTTSGVGIVVRAIFAAKKKGEAYHRMTRQEFLWEAAMPGGILLVIYFLLDMLGFYVCSFLMVIAVCFLQNIVIHEKYRPTKKDAVKVIVFAFGSTICMYIIFSVLLSMPTPAGILGI